jgi:hypothetical protein
MAATFLTTRTAKKLLRSAGRISRSHRFGSHFGYVLSFFFVAFFLSPFFSWLTSSWRLEPIRRTNNSKTTARFVCTSPLDSDSVNTTVAPRPSSAPRNTHFLSSSVIHHHLAYHPPPCIRGISRLSPGFLKYRFFALETLGIYHRSSFIHQTRPHHTRIYIV